VLVDTVGHEWVPTVGFEVRHPAKEGQQSRKRVSGGGNECGRTVVAVAYRQMVWTDVREHISAYAIVALEVVYTPLCVLRIDRDWWRIEDLLLSPRRWIMERVASRGQETSVLV
jgi:hypothetical protein